MHHAWSKEDDLKNENNLKNEDGLKIEDDIKKWRHKERGHNNITCKHLLMTSQQDRQTETDSKPEMLSAF